MAAAAPSGPPPETVRYAISGPREFRQTVQATLDDPRGWSLGGAVRFRAARSGTRFTVRLADPATVAGFPPCTANYSCHAGGLVLVNSMRWRDGAASYGDRLEEYRRHVINHEVGHALGFGHASCARPGAPAPLMQQQSKGLLGCRARAWPLPAERRILAAKLGVRVRRIGRVPAPWPLSAFARRHP